MEQQYLTVKQFAERAGVSTQRVYQLLTKSLQETLCESNHKNKPTNTCCKCSRFVFMGQGGISLQYYLPDTQKRHLSSASDLLRVMAGVVMGF